MTTTDRYLVRVLVGVVLTVIVLLLANTGHGGPASDDTPRLTPRTEQP